MRDSFRVASRIGGILALCLSLPALAQEPGTRVFVPEIPARPTLTDKTRAAATKAYADARRRYSSGDMKGALKAADAAFLAVPNSSTAVIRASVLERIGRAGEAFDVYLLALDMDPTEAERDLALKGLERTGKDCKPQRGWGRVASTPVPAEVEAGDVRFTTPRTIGFEAGVVSLRATARGRVPVTQRLTILAGQANPIAFTLEETLAVTPRVTPLSVATTPLVDRGKPGRVAGWVLVGSGGAMLATAIGMHLWALSAARDADRYAKPDASLAEDVRGERYDSAKSRMSRRATLAYVFYGAGVAATVTGAVLLILNRKPSRGVQVQPAAFQGGGGLVLSGGF
jgi:hypothetical protein